MNILSQNHSQSEQESSRLRFLLTKLYSDFSMRCHKSLLNRFRSNIESLLNMVQEGQCNVGTTLQQLKTTRSRSGCKADKRSQRKRNVKREHPSRTHRAMPRKKNGHTKRVNR